MNHQVEIGDLHIIYIYMGVSINGGTPKWMVSNGKSQSKMDDLGVLLF